MTKEGSRALVLQARPLDQRRDRCRVHVHLLRRAMAGMDRLCNERGRVAIADLAQGSDAGTGERGKGSFGQSEI